MNDFERCNKVSGVYWLKASVKNLKFNYNIQPTIEEHLFKWQEKTFSAWETQYYSDIHNCITDAEVKYNEIIKNNEIVPAKVFTYIHDDSHLPLPSDFKKNKVISKLGRCMEYLSMNDTVGSIGRVFGVKSDSMSHLLKNSLNSLCEEEKWTAMHVVFDHSDHNEDLQLLKQESTLVSIFHNTTQNYLILAPDVNDLESNPYAIESVDSKYGVSVDFGEMGGGEELQTLMIGPKCLLILISDLPPIKLYLEVISTDWRHNHRTEGYVSHPLPLNPGLRTQELTCLRPDEKSWRGEDRRFFLGG
ncbi:Meckel syndrome type 1 protein, partial [Operophtera brumata]